MVLRFVKILRRLPRIANVEIVGKVGHGNNEDQEKGY